MTTAKRYYAWAGDRLVTPYGAPTEQIARKSSPDVDRVEVRKESVPNVGTRLNEPGDCPRMRIF